LSFKMLSITLSGNRWRPRWKGRGWRVWSTCEYS